MKKIYTNPTGWLQTATLLIALLFGFSPANANIQQTKDLGSLVSGTTYDVPANTLVTGYFSAPTDGSITLTSSVEANTNLNVYSDANYSSVVTTARDEAAKTKSFDAISGTTYYFKQETGPSTTFSVTFTFTAVSNPEGPTFDYMPVTVVPANGSNVTELKAIEITTEVAKFPNFLSETEVKVYDSTNTEVATGTMDNSSDFSAISITFNPAITENGTYTVIIPKNSFGDDDWAIGSNNKGRANPELTYTYTVSEDAKIIGVVPTCDPADGSTVSSLQEIVMSFSEVGYPGGLKSCPTDKVSVYNENDEVVTEGSFSWTYADVNSFVTLKLNNEISESGTYTVKVPADIFVASDNNEIKSQAFNLTYTVEVSDNPYEDLVEPFTGFASINPADGSNVTELQNFTITVTEGYGNSNPDSPNFATIKDANGTVLTSLSVTDYDNISRISDTEIYISFKNKITADGTYTVNFPAGFLVYAAGPGKKSLMGDLTFTYTIGEVVTPEVTMTVDPVAGTYTQLDHFTITFDGAERIGLAERDEDGWTNVIQLQMASYGEYSSVMDFQILQAEGTANQYTLSPTPNRGYESFWPMTLAGSFRLYIPAGAFYFNGDHEFINEEMIIDYTISAGEKKEMTVVPAEGEVKNLQYINMIFTSNVTPNNSKDAEIVLSIDGTETERVPFSEVDYGFEDYEAQFNFSKKYTDPGTYTVYIPEGVVTFADGSESAERTLTYTIVGETKIDYTATIDPSEGVVEMLSDFTITFPNVNILGWDEYASKFPYVAIVNADESLTQISATMKFPADAANSASFGTFAEVTDPGKYAFVVPLESFTFDGQPGEGELIFYYEIEGATPTYTVSVSPAPGEVSAEQMKSFTITFEGVTGIEFNPIGTYGSLYQIDEEGNHLKEYQSAPLIVSENAYTFTPFYPPTEPGKYRLIVPVRAVYFTDADGVYGPTAEHVFDYTLTDSGIDGIDADATDLNVYSIDGVCLLRNAKAADLKNLAKGIYIVNGQKVIIR